MYVNSENVLGRTFDNIYNRDSLNDLGIPIENKNSSQFIEVGNILVLDGYECKVKVINIKLEPQTYDMGIGEKHNCQIGVFVERMKKV